MLFGENSRLPVYQTAYSGSLKDVSTLQATLAKFNAITDSAAVTAVMDKGFYSKDNIDMMLSNKHQFLIAAPFTAKFAKAQVDAVRGDIQTYKNAIRTNSGVIYGTTLQAEWSKTSSLSAHVYFNPHQELADKEKYISAVKEMEQEARLNPGEYAENAKYTRFLDFSENESALPDGCTITVKEDVLNSLHPYCGWLVILTNRLINAEEAISVYRAKDVVEKGFDKLKNSLDLGRLRVHSSQNAQNKMFIGFVALIMLAEINKTMSDKQLYEKGFTINKLLNVLSKQKTYNVGENKILTPPTKQQKLIFNAFSVTPPVLV
jgi:transposase